MSEISVIGNAVVGNVRATAPTAPTNPVEVAAPAVDSVGVATTDSVEFSQQAQLLEKIQQLPSVRQDQIDAIKDAIASNTYITDDKLDLAIDRMIDEAAT
jgi:anti-sigma28 factor (negative regulator of flagellin synthesis)